MATCPAAVAVPSGYTRAQTSVACAGRPLRAAGLGCERETESITNKSTPSLETTKLYKLHVHSTSSTAQHKASPKPFCHPQLQHSPPGYSAIHTGVPHTPASCNSKANRHHQSCGWHPLATRTTICASIMDDDVVDLTMSGDEGRVGGDADTHSAKRAPTALNLFNGVRYILGFRKNIAAVHEMTRVRLLLSGAHTHTHSHTQHTHTQHTRSTHTHITSEEIARAGCTCTLHVCNLTKALPLRFAVFVSPLAWHAAASCLQVLHNCERADHSACRSSHLHISRAGASDQDHESGAAQQCVDWCCRSISCAPHPFPCP